MESLQGKGGAPGSSAAATYFWEAVRDGNVPAEVALANLYLRGDGVPKDCEQARALLDAAASLGDPGAPRVIASMPSYGCESSAKQNPRERPPSHP
jgi:TPR repeat protein